MVIVIMIQTSSMVVLKVALSKGMNKYVMMVYTGALATLILLPCALFLHRSGRPPVTFSVLCSLFVLSLFGCGAQISAYLGIDFSSPTLAMAMMNLITPFTFILTLIFRMEEFHWRLSSSQAKVLGTIISISGAFVITFYKGPSIFKGHFSLPSHNELVFPPHSNWIFGGFFCAIEALLASASYLYQVRLLSLKSNGMAVKARYGIINHYIPGYVCNDVMLCVVLMVLAEIWTSVLCYVQTLGNCIYDYHGYYLFGEDFHLGSLIGAVIIVLGFYAVMWGKTMEEKIEGDIENSESCSDKVPLIQNRTQQI
ncbi:hypothetical protein L6164_020595 [Bauhinia variegata]|uniref:Uncharacterized protein n=1 Tax=Bauhinia variegata TaxID=167791 RepID=A0ACB9MVW6_BAUVA|nr:hypothetical protein L6164_020595 [Bauhinia variegata]